MKFFTLRFLTLTVILTGHCQLKAQSYNYNIDDSKIALQGYSSVSYVDFDMVEIGSINFKTQLDGVTYYFTSKEQLDRFKSTPEKYVPKYGGWCAFAMYKGAKFRPDPKRFKIIDGRLYLFTKNVEGDYITEWNKEDQQKLIEKANQNWESLRRL